MTIEPSALATKAAEEIENEYDLSNGTLEYQVPFVAEIIERETRIGKALDLIQRFVDAANADNRGTDLWEEARTFLKKP